VAIVLEAHYLQLTLFSAPQGSAVVSNAIAAAKKRLASSDRTDCALVRELLADLAVLRIRKQHFRQHAKTAGCVRDPSASSTPHTHV
jgi:hypothetical protein